MEVEIRISVASRFLPLFSETAQSHGGKGIQDAVLTVPVGFSADQKRAVRSA